MQVIAIPHPDLSGEDARLSAFRAFVPVPDSVTAELEF